MSGLGKLGIVDRVTVTFLNTCHLIIADGMKFIVCDRSYLSLELIKLDGDICIVEGLQGDWISCIVNQYVRIHTDLYQMDNVILYDT